MRTNKPRDGPTPQLQWLEHFLDLSLGVFVQMLSALTKVGGKMVFDGARHFWSFSLLTVAACILATSVTGWWSLPAAGVALYLLLGFYNALERRDLIEIQRPKRRSRIGRASKHKRD